MDLGLALRVETARGARASFQMWVFIDEEAVLKPERRGPKPRGVRQHPRCE